MFLPLLCVFGTASCTGTDDGPPDDLAPLYVEAYDRLQANPPSDLVARIVEDYQVTDAEFTEAQQAFRDCVSAQAPSANPQTFADGSYQITLADDLIAQYGEGEAAETAATDALNAITEACAAASVDEVSYLYLEPVMNPWGYRNYPEAFRACMEAIESDLYADLGDDELMEVVMAEDYVAPDPNTGACATDPWAKLKDLGR